MNLERVDQEIAQWRERLQLAAENLRDFVQLPAYQWTVSGAAAGQTAARIVPIASAMSDLQSYLDLLTGIVDRAASSRQTVSRVIPSSGTLREIEELLEGPSVTLTLNPTPPEQRELLRPIRTVQAITPRELLETMLESFRVVRDVVLEVDAARSRVSELLAALEQDLAQCRGSAPNSGTTPKAADAESKLAALKTWASADPLAAEAQATAFESYMDLAGERAMADVGQRGATQAALAENKALLAKLIQVHERAHKVDAERKLKVAEEPAAAMNDDSAVAPMAGWLERLELTISEDKIGPASIGLAKWRLEAERRLAAEQAVIRLSEAALNRRRDLCGLMDALAAKARQTGRADDPTLAALAGQAVDLLRRRPTPMAQARDAVRDYEARLL